MQIVLDVLHQIPTPVVALLFIIIFFGLMFADSVDRTQSDPVGIDNPPMRTLAFRYVFGILVAITILLVVYEMIIGLATILVDQTALTAILFN